MNPMGLFSASRRRKLALSSASALLVICANAHAENVNLSFDSLPSSQGWTYWGGPLAEDAAFFADGSSLVQRTVGSGTDSFASYRMNDIVDLSRPTTLSVTARVLSYERLSWGSVGLGFNFYISDGTNSHRLALKHNRLQVNGQFIRLDTTVFRDYVFALYPGGMFDLFVDGRLLTSGRTGPGFNNVLFFGDSTGHENTDAEITALSFTSVVDVDIDIKPGSFPNSINPRSRGLIPVALLGSEDFDVTDVDVTTLAFGSAGSAPKHDLTDEWTYNEHLQDVNLDGFVDLVAHFPTQETGILCGDTEATLSGELLDGSPFEGTDAISTVGCRLPPRQPQPIQKLDAVRPIPESSVFGKNK